MNADECCDDAAVSAINCTDHQNKKEENKSCSSFCRCACCVQVFVLHGQIGKTETAAVPAASKKQFLQNNSHPFSGFAGNIWQPPKNC
jgi:hypothetical protein